MSVTIEPRSFWESIGRSCRARDSFLIRPTEAEYWESGQKDARYLIEGTKRHGRQNLGMVVDYGSGDGRVARFMAGSCDRLYCMDVAESVLNLARWNLEYYGLDNVEYVLAERCENEGFADFLYSLQVVQHNPPEMQVEMLKRMYRFLKPDGLACVHLPAIENKPGYVNSNTCMCFTREEASALASVFDEYLIEFAPMSANGEGPGASDYFIWGRRGLG